MKHVNYTHKIVELIKEAQKIASEHGFHNLLQPGLVKELIIADILGHDVHKTKHKADAHSPDNFEIKYEYLSCFQTGSFQLDRMFKSPETKRQKSLERISRNEAIYCAVFDKNNPLNILQIYEVETDVLLCETERQLHESINDISHIGFSVKWVKENGEKVYDNGKLLRDVNQRSTSSVSKEFNRPGKNNPQLSFVFTTGIGEDSNDADDYRGATQGENSYRSAKEGSGNGVGYGGTKVGAPQAPTNSQDPRHTESTVGSAREFFERVRSQSRELDLAAGTVSKIRQFGD